MSASYDDEDILSLLDSQQEEIDVEDPEEEDSGALAAISVPPPSGALAGALGESKARLADIQTRYGANEAKSEALYTRQQEILDKAMQRLMQTKAGPGKAEMMLALAASLNKPTRTGRFGETMGNVSGTGVELLGKKRDAEDERAQLIEKYGLAGAETGLKRLDSSQRQLAIEAEAERKRVSDLTKAGVVKEAPLQPGFKRLEDGSLIDTGTGKRYSGAEYQRLLHPPRAAASSGVIGSPATPEDAGSMAKAVAEYDIAFPTRYTMKSMGINPDAFMAQVKALNPDWSQQTFVSSQRALNAYMSGPAATAVQSFNAATDHLETFAAAVDALKNGDIKAFNAASQWVAEQTGHPAPKDFNAIKQIVSTEVIKGVIGGQFAMQDREEAAKEVERSSSPQQLYSVINKWGLLMGGQLRASEKRYVSTTKRNDFESMLEPAAIKWKNTTPTGAPPSGAKPAEAAAPKPAAKRESLPDPADVVPGSKINVYEGKEKVDVAILKDGKWVSEKTGKPITG